MSKLLKNDTQFEVGYHEAIDGTLEAGTQALSDEKFNQLVAYAKGKLSQLSTEDQNDYEKGLLEGYQEWSIWSDTLNFKHKKYVTSRGVESVAVNLRDIPMPEDNIINSIKTLNDAYQLGKNTVLKLVLTNTINSITKINFQSFIFNIKLPLYYF